MLSIEQLNSVPYKPSVTILIAPTDVGEISKSVGFLNQALHMAAAFSISPFRLSDGLLRVPLKGEFFVAKFGIIHFLHHLNTDDQVSIPQEFYINTDAGTYKVLKDDSRKEVIPAGLWSFLRYRAMELMKKYRDFPVRHVEATLRKQLANPPSEAKETFMFDSAAATDSETLLSTPKLLKHSSAFQNANFLPQGFAITHNPSHTGRLVTGSVAFPESHSVLLHATFPQQSGSMKETIFLALGTSKGFSADKPYVIYHCQEASLQLSVGFLFSGEFEDITTQDLLPGSPILKGDRQLSLVQQARTKSDKLLPEILKVKGVYSLQSLNLRRIITG